MINRRLLITLLTAFVSNSLLPVSAAQAPAGIRVEKLNYFEIRVSDIDRSLAFYQQMFGMPVQSRSDDRILLKIGEQNKYMAIRPLLSGEAPAITQLGYSVLNYDLENQLAVLKASGFQEIDPPDITLPGIENTMSTWVKLQGNTPTLYFSDARGLIVRLTDPAWCGGQGPLGNTCGTPEAVSPGVIQLGEINHFTSFVNDGAGANLFYQDFFDLEIQAYQGPNSPVTGIGDGKQFVMYAGPFPGGENAPANIHHVSFNLDGFIVDDILGRFETQGITDRGERQIGPMMHYISLRMPERGGVEGGTPEVYFTDPDGILVQLQDTTYCGGGGYLGNQCLK
ncbi:MAG: VOC family protein [Gammaproteobacteria bacterium]|nr:VOC family protein [Gammaproteobacteria bacterium]